jgi:hypothetical protein
MARDPGLQPERTRLAWTRTVLASFAVTLVLARLDALQGWQGRGIPALLALAATVASWLGAWYRARHASAPACPRAPGPLLASIALATTATALAAILLTLPPG